jgi:PEGA domain-containing protein
MSRAVPGSDKPPAPDLPPAVEVGRDGKIEGLYRGTDARREWTPMESARLELMTQKKKAVAEPQLPRAAPVSPRKKFIALGVIAAAVVLPFAARWGSRAWADYQARQVKASGLIVIDSVPTNARVFINGSEVGRTPYITPNTFQVGSEIPMRVVYPGAQDWTGSFPGGVNTTVTAELQAQTPQ